MLFSAWGPKVEVLLLHPVIIMFFSTLVLIVSNFIVAYAFVTCY